MKVKYAVWVLLGLLVLATAVSCKSSPPPEAVTPPPERDAPDQDSLNALEAAEDRALAAQKLISDFEGPSAFPEDWKAANSLLVDADRRKSTSTLQEVRESTDRYITAAKAYEGMTGEVLGLYYEARAEELMAARDAAVDAGAWELIPEYLEEADDTVANAVEKYEAGNYYVARDTATEALAMYQVLKLGLDAYDVRMAIADRNFEDYDPQNVELADDTLRDAALDYSANDLAGAKDKVNTAMLLYNQAMATAWESYAADKGAEAASDRQTALDMRANVAVRPEYNAAQDVYNRANSAFQEQKFDEAARGFEDSVRRFGMVIAETRIKRTAAEEALERANQKMAESDEKARNAEIILEGGEE